MTGCSQSRIGDSMRWEWSVPTGSSGQWLNPARSSAVIGHGLAYIGGPDGNIYALELASGREAWKFDTHYEIGSSPLLVEDCVVVGSSSHSVYCLGALDGKKRWEFAGRNQFSASPNWFAGEDGASGS